MDNRNKPLTGVTVILHGVNPTHNLGDDVVSLGGTLVNDLPLAREAKSEIVLVVEPCNLQELVFKQAVRLNVPVVSKSWLIACKMFEMEVQKEHFLILDLPPCHQPKEYLSAEKEVLPFRRIENVVKRNEEVENGDNLVDSLRLQAELLQLSPVGKPKKLSKSNVMSPSTVDRVYAETKEMRRMLAESTGKRSGNKS